MSDEELKKLHIYLIEIFEEFKRICQKYNLKYFSIAGTTLGAIRHKGFIPWDDDLDIGMPIEDYMIFKEIARNELKKPFRFIDALDRESSKNYFSKIENENTTFIEEDDKEFKKGIWIDIIPFSGIPDNKINLYFFFKKLFICLRLDQYYNKNINNCKTIKSKFFKMFASLLCYKKEKNYYIKKFEKLMERYPFYNSKNVFYAWKLKLSYNTTQKYTLFDSNVFKEVKLVKFENTEMNIPIGYDKYLKKCYGDYMQIPPVEKRKIHKPYILDFEKSYKMY